MSEIDLESQDSSEDEGLGPEKLVPLHEAVRYRKRAQSAEKEAAAAKQQLQESVSGSEVLAEQLDEMKVDRKLSEMLTEAGVCDLEAAVLLARARLKDCEGGDVESVVERLRKEKRYLFVERDEVAVGVGMKTSGVKDGRSGGRRVLEGAATKAAVSGSRNDVHEYMRARRAVGR
ncbi:MAG: hypothetical protein KAR47_12215 [Planctomycetes bacterium]|nr:hypothetical protein [Planctomycetota bacterium]